MEYIEVSAKTVDDAILEAAIKFGTTREKIAYEVLSQGSAGFLGIGSKKAVIKAHVQTDHIRPMQFHMREVYCGGSGQKGAA